MRQCLKNWMDDHKKISVIVNSEGKRYKGYIVSFDEIGIVIKLSTCELKLAFPWTAVLEISEA